MSLEANLEKLHEELYRLTKELNRVVKMIKAAGKGARAAVQEYGRQRKPNQGVPTKASKAVAKQRPANVRPVGYASMRAKQKLSAVAKARKAPGAVARFNRGASQAAFPIPRS